jgi:hypothetical protein
MNRRSFLGFLASLPFVGRFTPKCGIGKVSAEIPPLWDIPRLAAYAASGGDLRRIDAREYIRIKAKSPSCRIPSLLPGDDLL